MADLRVLAILVPVLACLSGCPSGGDATGGLAEDAALSTSTWLAVDLADGSVAAVADQGGLLDQPRWRDRWMLFRRMPARSVTLTGSRLGMPGEADDASGAVASGLCWMAVFETTREQWARIGETPASDIPVGLLPADIPGAPAVGIPPAAVQAAVAAVPVRRMHLALPTAAEWTLAASGGRDRIFAWGDSSDSLLFATYANTIRADSAATGILPVGSRQPSDQGLCDLHGNVWELVDDGGVLVLRGGAWDSAPMQCRIANRVAIPADLAHPGVGFRLVLRP